MVRTPLLEATSKTTENANTGKANPLSAAPCEHDAIASTGGNR